MLDGLLPYMSAALSTANPLPLIYRQSTRGHQFKVDSRIFNPDYWIIESLDWVVVGDVYRFGTSF